MIKYDRLWDYLKKSGVTQYRLFVSGISTSTISRLKHNKPVTTETLDKLCTILDCGLDEIVEFVKAK